MMRIETKRRLIKGLRIAFLVAFLLVALPSFFVFIFWLDIHKTTYTIDSFNSQDIKYLQDNVDLLEEMPNGSTIDKVVYHVPSWPDDTPRVFYFYLTIPKEQNESFLSLKPPPPKVNVLQWRDITVINKNDKNYFIRFTCIYMEGFGNLEHWAQENGVSNKNIQGLYGLLYLFGVAIVSIIIIFPYRKIFKKKRAQN